MPLTSTRVLARLGLSPLLFAACFNPPTGGGTETEGGGPCEAGQSQPCVCEDGSMSTQVCGEDNTFGTCECGGTTTAGTLDESTGDPPDTTDTTEGTTGEPPECVTVDECEDPASECEVVSCRGGMCVVANADAGVACGDDTEAECNAADTCDGRGACADNIGGDGVSCATCDGDVCVCTAGACDSCTAFAATNEFLTPRSVEGWELTGGWGLYVRAPQSFESGGVSFGNQVLGTDGNRVSPFPGAELELSYARTRPTILPASLDFLSWHVDEGGLPGPALAVGFDSKRIRVSVDGGTSWTPLVDCAALPAMVPAFCMPRLDPRASDDWDAISIPLPPALVGQSAIIEFAYDSVDECCGQEQGWFIDALNFATECECGSDAACESFGGECGAAACGVAGACEPTPEAVDTPCGDPTSNGCTGADRCNGDGQCIPVDASAYVTECLDCPSGDCSVCVDGACNDCAAGVNDFAGPVALGGWTTEVLDPMVEPSGWGLYAVVPRNQEFDAGMIQPGLLVGGPALGNDGNRDRPYPGGSLENSRITSPADIIPASLMFDSWHQDEGGANGSMYDNKIIEISIDGGASWSVLVDCSTEDFAMPEHPFCMQLNGPRAMDDWDAISIPMGAFGGLMGLLRLTYSTQDSCCNFERGWYLDNLNFAQFCG